jgi:tRNA(fMet)-specific endonuclease VapC
MRFLLDTNAVSDLVRNPQGKCAARIAAVGENKVLTSIIVASELRYGALKKNSIRLTRQLETVLSVLEVAPFEAPADTVYAKVRTQLEAAGTPIGGNDLLIASHKEFSLASTAFLTRSTAMGFMGKTGFTGSANLQLTGGTGPTWFESRLRH